MRKQIINPKIVLKLLSKNLYIISFAIFGCIGVALYFHDPVFPFIIPAVFSALLGIFFDLVFNTSHEDEKRLSRKEAFFTVTLSWLIISLIGSVPFLLSHSIPRFIDAFFESISGFTTTGSSILQNIEAVPKSILFWRSLTHWIGGLGIIVLVIIVMPSINSGGYKLFSLESSLTEKIKPRVKAIGYRLLFIYLSLTFAEIIFLMLGKMNLFESVCHSFGTIATGGFSPKNDSIAGYSPYIQYVIMVFMFLSGTSFVIHYFLWKGNFKRIWVNEEFKFYIILVLFFGSIISLSLFVKMHLPFEKAFRDGFFQLISIITTTGFATADYLKWPVFAWFTLFIVMFFGGCTGSTSGGIKIVRHLVLFKNIQRIFKKQSFPKGIFTLKLNGLNLDEETNRTFLTFISVYIIFFLILSLLLILDGVDIETAASSIATTMAGIGPGLSTVGPVSNFAHLNDFSKFVLTFSMLIGRLEIYTVIMLFAPAFWKK